LKHGSPTASPKEMVALTCRITAGYRRGNALPAADVASVIGTVHGSLAAQTTGAAAAAGSEAGRSNPPIGHGRVHRLPGQKAENAQASPTYAMTPDQYRAKFVNGAGR
jgi:predicted transcriptional regulator